MHILEKFKRHILWGDFFIVALLEPFALIIRELFFYEGFSFIKNLIACLWGGVYFSFFPPFSHLFPWLQIPQLAVLYLVYVMGVRIIKSPIIFLMASLTLAIFSFYDAAIHAEGKSILNGPFYSLVNNESYQVDGGLTFNGWIISVISAESLLAVAAFIFFIAQISKTIFLKYRRIN